MAKRSFYFSSFKEFVLESNESILGKLTEDNTFDIKPQQKNIWKKQIELIKSFKKQNNLINGSIIFEYTIPRVGKRVDVVLLIDKLVILLEFKGGSNVYSNVDMNQVAGYRDDLYDFHEYSWKNELKIIPILVSEDGKEVKKIYKYNKLMNPICANFNNLENIINKVIEINNVKKTKYTFKWTEKWHNSKYHPTPTIIEAAEYMFNNHTVEDISRNDATAKNLNKTYECIAEIIEYSKKNNKKSICFITGVPGAGKTLAGLQIAIQRRNIDNNEHVVFLSGNQPLVTVLQEALARNAKLTLGISKSKAKSEAKSFIQIIHHFRDEMIDSKKAPIEHVAIFDESQRAWSKEHLEKFMKTKKGINNYKYSEPQFLIKAMDRHEDWAVIICLVGGGQEINTGEAGIKEWFLSIEESFPEWNVYISSDIEEFEYTEGDKLDDLIPGAVKKEELHLRVPMHTYRSPRVSEFIKEIIDGNKEKALNISKEITKFPIYLTRNVIEAKKWANNQIGKYGNKRIGLISSSNAIRLQAEGIFVKNGIKVESWFLDDRDDIRSSYSLETVATEFDIQGLEIDYSIVGWDLNFRLANPADKIYREFRGKKWVKVNSFEKQKYIKNVYRVLLTRAREGMIIFVPFGDKTNLDKTRPCEEYDKIYNYLKECGIKEIKSY